MNTKFKSSALVDLLAPDEVILADNGMTVSIINVFDGKECFFPYSDIVRVEVNTGMIFAKVIFRLRNGETISTLDNFRKDDARKIAQLVGSKIVHHHQECNHHH